MGPCAGSLGVCLYICARLCSPPQTAVAMPGLAAGRGLDDGAAAGQPAALAASTICRAAGGRGAREVGRADGARRRPASIKFKRSCLRRAVSKAAILGCGGRRRRCAARLRPLCMAGLSERLGGRPSHRHCSPLTLTTHLSPSLLTPHPHSSSLTLTTHPDGRRPHHRIDATRSL